LNDSRALSIVIAAPAPTSVNVTAQGGATTVAQGGQLQFSANVLPAQAPQQVQWGVAGHTGATISNAGLLTVNASVPVGTALTVTATANGTSVSGNATVNVAEAVTSFTVTFDLNGGTHTGGGQLTQTVQAGSAATAPTVTYTNHSFSGWSSSVTGMTLGNITGNVTFTANWTWIGGGNDNGTSNGGTWTPTQNATNFTIHGVTVNFTVSNNIATLQMPDAVITQIINATNNGNFNSTVSFNLSNLQGRSNLTGVQMPSVALERFANANLAVEIRLPNGTVHLDDVAAANAAEQASANITISLSRLTNAQRNQLNNAQRAVINNGDAIFRITMASGNVGISDFGDGVATVTLPFTGIFPAAVWYMNNAGEFVKMESTYNRTARTITFTTNHLSLFVAGHDDGTRNEVTAGDTDEGITDIPPGGYPNANYNPLTGAGDTEWINPFVDVSEVDWFFESVRFAHQNNLFSGTSATTFSPNSPMTRAMMVTVLHRMAGEPSVSGIANNFTDVQDGAWYDNAVRWAAANGIVSGIGNSQFAPGNNITREQMAVILNNFARHMGLDLPTIRTGVFVDEAEISAWAQDAVNALFEAGVISGMGNNHFNPRGQGTRAEVATMLRNFMDAVRFGPFAAGTDDYAILRDEDLYYHRKDEDESEQSLDSEENGEDEYVLR